MVASKKCIHRINGYLGGSLFRVAVNAGADSGKSNRAVIVCRGQLQAIFIGVRQ